jgi:hypothetical protein
VSKEEHEREGKREDERRGEERRKEKKKRQIGERRHYRGRYLIVAIGYV